VRRPQWTVIDDARDDRGSAIIEFVFVSVIVMVPLVYLIVAVAQVQRSSLAVTAAARAAGRAFATADTTADGIARATIAARFALQDQGIDESPTVRYFAVGTGCAGRPVGPQLRAGSEYTVCVIRTVALPGVPNVLSGRGVTTTGEYVVHVDDFRAVGP
jgi:hypothetical protein